MRVSEARDRYFADNGFELAGYTAKWAHFKLGPIPLAFPNTPSRQAALPMHDLHHLATGYPTTLVGEAEIGAWELGGGCGAHTAAWVLNGLAMAYGLVLAPRKVWRAFQRGRKSTNLYQRGWSNALLDLELDELRALVSAPTFTTSVTSDAQHKRV